MPACNLKVSREYVDGPVMVRALSGKLDETFVGAPLVTTNGQPFLVFDISEVSHVSSFGVREWVRWLNAATQSLQGVFYVRASPRMVDQFNMVIGFGGGGTLLSFQATYLCETCGNESLTVFDCQLDRPSFDAMEAPTRQCRICGADAGLDDEAAVLFEYARSAELGALPPPVNKALRSEASWLDQVPGVRLWTRQSIVGSSTAFALAGTVDAAFPARRIVDTAAGSPVQLNLRDIANVDPAGIDLMSHAALALSKSAPLTFHDVPPVVLHRAAAEPTILAGGTVASLALPAQCPRCISLHWLRSLGPGFSKPSAGSCPVHEVPLKLMGEPEHLEAFRKTIFAASRVDLEAARQRLGDKPRSKPVTANPRQAETKDLFAGQYELLAKLGTGGMAEVHIARHHGAMGFRRVVVIKRILPDLLIDDRLVRLFLDEAKLAARIEHPNVIRVYDLGRAENSYFMALEYVHGRSLADIGRGLALRNETVPVAHAVRIIADLARGLARAHARSSSGQQLVHRDITPGNVAVSFDGVVKLLDFGLAGLSQGNAKGRFGDSVVLGSPAYIAPEILLNQDAGPEADIWGAGLLLLSLLAGKPYFHRPTWERTMYAILTEPASCPPGVPKDLFAVISKALDKRPEGRFRTAEDLETELRRCARSLGPADDMAEWLQLVFADEIKVEKRFLQTTGSATLIDALLRASPSEVAEFYKELQVSRETMAFDSAAENTQIVED